MTAKRRLPCGTDAGYKYHLAHGSVPCELCLRAHARVAQFGRERGRCATGIGWPLLPGKMVT